MIYFTIFTKGSGNHEELWFGTAKGTFDKLVVINKSGNREGIWINFNIVNKVIIHTGYNKTRIWPAVCVWSLTCWVSPEFSRAVQNLLVSLLSGCSKCRLKSPSWMDLFSVSQILSKNISNSSKNSEVSNLLTRDGGGLYMPTIWIWFF